MRSHDTGTTNLIYVDTDIFDVTPGSIIAFLTNDRTATWGAGVARQVATRAPHVQAAFRRAVAATPDALHLGALHVVLDDSIAYAAIVAQHGIGPSPGPRIRYCALERALTQLAGVAKERRATIHLPRIGTGASGGRWDDVAPIIARTLASLPVIIHDRPPRRPRRQRPARAQ